MNVGETKVLSKNQLKKARKRKFLELQAAKLNQPETATDSNNQVDKKSGKSVQDVSEDTDFKGKKKLFLERLQKKREQNGITLLPSKVERKIYNIKRRLREKGFSSQMIKEIVRKERRTEELKFRKTFSTKPCFNCRQMGHLLADCPLSLGKSTQETGICFKCGSTEHTSYQCKKKVIGYPLAKCFVCKEQGHISRDCPKNEHGVYPRGGKCGLCGNVNHLRKDCPNLKKKEEETFTAHTFKEGASVDAEIVDKKIAVRKQTPKRPKIVNF